MAVSSCSKLLQKHCPLFATSGCDSLLVHAAAKSFNVITDIGDHTVPFVSLRSLLTLVWGRAVATSSSCSVAIGGGIGGGAGCAPVAAEAVCDDPSAVFDTNGLKEILKVLAVLLRYERAQTWKGIDNTECLFIMLFCYFIKHALRFNFYTEKLKKVSCCKK